ncbi:hypothetical protein L1049_020573 [Liquidambar formosana]|uniref:Uncharacterized protein n=1 Tax=Liquidambar formosana TaxID=63359 RepID=A0AAP0X464_LIQFO
MKAEIGGSKGSIHEGGVWPGKVEKRLRKSFQDFPLTSHLEHKEVDILVEITHYSSLLGTVEGFKDGMNPNYLLHKDGIQMNFRKLLLLDAELDYDDAGPNPKHDPRKGKPGIGGAKNP